MARRVEVQYMVSVRGEILSNVLIVQATAEVTKGWRICQARGQPPDYIMIGGVNVSKVPQIDVGLTARRGVDNKCCRPIITVADQKRNVKTSNLRNT